MTPSETWRDRQEEFSELAASQKNVVGMDVTAPLPGFGPGASLERIATLDVLRGFALLGILVVSWSVDLPWDMEPWKGWTNATDLVAYWIVNFFLLEKSRPIFAFLFGLGFYIQMQRTESRGSRFIPVYTRRLVILFLIGAAHYILAEHDILYRYAICGFLLLPLRKLKLNLLIVLALICVLIPFTRNALIARDHELRVNNLNSARVPITLDPNVLGTYVGVYELESGRTLFVTRDGNELFGQPGGGIRFRLFAESPTKFFWRRVDAQVSFVTDSTGTVTGLVSHQGGRDVPGRMVQAGQEAIDDQARRRASNQGPTERTYATGTFGQIVSMRAPEFWKHISSWTYWLGELGDPFPYFLLGLYAGRRRIFHEIAAHRQFIRKVMWWGLALGLTGTTAQLFILWPAGPFYSEFTPFSTRTLVRFGERVGSPAMALTYIAALTLLLERDTWKKRLAPLGAVGRMALTNYLLQSVAFVLLFFGYGLGWYAQVGAFGGVMLALPVFALQIAASIWWLRRFRFGPAEWLWRSLTYGKLQPMKIEQW